MDVVAPALRAKGLVKGFRSTRAVDGVDLEVRPGERVALLGPNGAGKTTTLLMCLGTITPDEGSVEIFGHHLPKGRSKAMERVGFAAGYLPLPDRLRVREVLSIFADLCGADRSGDAVVEALERFDVVPPGRPDVHRAVVGPAHHRRHRQGRAAPPGACSCSTSPPRPWIPMSPSGSARALDRLNAEDGTTLLVTSHDMNEVERLCERVVFLQHGRVVARRHARRHPERARPRVPRGRVPPPRRRTTAAAGGVVSGRRVFAVTRRHAYVLMRSPHRWFDVFIWPVVDVLLWGSLGVFVANQSPDADRAGVTYLLAGILLFHVLYQSQIAASTGFLEETWSRNLLNLLATPLTEVEYAAGVALFGLAKLTVAMGVVTLAAFAFFAFSIADIGWALVPIGLLLLLCGWSISLFVVGLVLRFGQSAEVLAWGILFVVMPLSGVFYPVDALPPVLQPIARVLPTTHIFAAARTVLDGQPLPWDQLAIALVGTIALAGLGLLYVTTMLRTFRQRGYVTRFS